MGRKQLAPEEGMQKTLSLRISEWLTQYLERSREALEREGQKLTTSDVARQLLINSAGRDMPIGFVVDKEEMLRGILRAQRDDLPLTQHHYAFLADQAHTTYQQTRRDFVRADLLKNNLNAFAAFITLCKQQGHDIPDDRARYYRSNLGTKAQEKTDLPDSINEGNSLVDSLGIPFRTTGEFMSRNLEVALRDEKGLADDEVDRVLRPYLPGLLLLALRSFTYENDRPVDGVENHHEMIDRLKIRASLNHRNEHFSISFADGNGDLSVLITPASSSWMLTCRYERFVDFVELTRLDRGAESDYFRLEHVPHMGGVFFLSAKGAEVNISIRFTQDEMLGMRTLCNVISAEPEYARVFKLLELRYGSV
ncbi:hypothetical protein [Sulfurisoma sediminicola]|uniref:Uncharacterized protein n=1 Tax=Sulfurisoma sediminicola TaxID=1381557 RepID=A0A497XF33_9PROT|nr:hypothetical protein [Sulfurisoma sediminicola]RLJ64767.1 hypothetical protein DFR35_1413 [Sulfurisoma sediminicola]